jgi:hypothetical protein
MTSIGSVFSLAVQVLAAFMAQIVYNALQGLEQHRQRLDRWIASIGSAKRD